jgi:glutaredoxin
MSLPLEVNNIGEQVMTITIYSTANCAACHELTRWLEQLGLPYVKKITDQDEAAMDEFMAVNDGMIAVPFTIITDEQGGRTKISGFDQKAFKAALHL